MHFLAKVAIKQINFFNFPDVYISILDPFIKRSTKLNAKN